MITVRGESRQIGSKSLAQSIRNDISRFIKPEGSDSQ
jgi:hypothetical protein